ncbi:YxeA family protein [Enterococcus crotali]|uniref:YxeA family protein n=1 Tax=Enterococcus crotali TaxID=1453587 RepID=UPI0004719D93|nr:YxeA family protein [Enterococcus crotali]
MKKIISILALLVIGLIFYKGFGYYQSTYVGTETYALIPETVPTRSETKDDSGALVKNSHDQQLYSYDYSLNGVTKKGEKRTLKLSITDLDPKPLIPNSFIKVTASKKRVLDSPVQVSENELPDSVKNSLLQ